MNFRWAFFFCCAALFISPTFGDLSDDPILAPIIEDLKDLKDDLNNISKHVVLLLSGTADKVGESLLTIATSVFDIAITIPGMVKRVKKSVNPILNNISSNVDGFLDSAKGMLQYVQSLLKKRTDTVSLNDFLSQYRKQLIEGNAAFQDLLNSWAAWPVNGLLTLLGDNRYQLLKSMEEPIPMLCALQADTTADADARATATAFLEDIRTAVSQIKLGQCNGVSCLLTLIPTAQRIAKLTNCA